MRVTGLPAPPVRWITGRGFGPVCAGRGLAKARDRRWRRASGATGAASIFYRQIRQCSTCADKYLRRPTPTDTYAACTYTADHPRRLRCPAVNVLTRPGAAYTERDNL